MGAVASGLMSDTAATQAMLDAVRQGATDEQVLTVGILRGLTEVLLEMFKAGKVLRIDNDTMKKVVEFILSKGAGDVFDGLKYGKK